MDSELTRSSENPGVFRFPACFSLDEPLPMTVAWPAMGITVVVSTSRFSMNCSTRASGFMVTP
ncbi:MAG: hypothetical protein WBN57_11340 [Gammaproteobacteria bacterium]